ncbi:MULTISPECIES: hypothetical protein [unclassified Pseudoalteromonas]|uniref:hypothetical protein n=1 Tax=unclassified Pseudoalteromonas TaxID=194690 RepID=UPI000694E8D2|nr:MULTISPECIES: hypothetical protein [unclassified Pseudoalteromonas]
MEFTISPKKAVMDSHLFENSSIGLEMMSVININIELEPLEFEEEVNETSIQLDFIDIPFKSIADIEGKVFEFPVNPEDGYIDGSIYLNSQHIPVDITKIIFGKALDNKVNVHFIGVIPLADEGFDKPNIIIDSKCELEFEGVFIPRSILEASQENLDKSYGLIKSFYDMSKLSKAKIINNGFMDVIAFQPVA